VHTGGQTTILGAGASANGQDPWYRRAADRLPAARYVAILLVGIVVVGGGIAYGLTQLGGGSSTSGSNSPSPSGNPGAKQGKKQRTSSAAIKPADVSVAVLNGTTTNFLASTYGRKLQALGFNVGNEANANQGQVNETVVLFKPGKSAEAGLVRRKLGVTQIEPADQAALSQAGGADVIVVLGADLAQNPTP
jgi:hypothetical protein